MKMRYVVLSVALALPVIGVGANANPDSAFYRHAAEGGMAEVAMGQLAQDKSSNANVKEFGAMMVRDHSAANEKLKAIAASKNISLPTSPSIGRIATKKKLEILSGDTFDKSYIDGMVKDHEEDIALFKKEAAAGQDPEAKAYAVSTLPTLRAHLRRVQFMAGKAAMNTR
jgi:putative membrane protein